MKRKLVIIGLSTTASQVYDFVTGYDLFEVVGFAVNREYKTDNKFCGLPVYETETLEEVFDIHEIRIFVALLWNRLNADRRKLYEDMKARGFTFANLISPSAVIRGNLAGDNCWIHDYVIIQTGAEIMADCMIMAFTLVGAYSKIESHCFLGTKSTVAGGCVIGRQSFVGINCTVFDNTVVGEKCILGACTAVKRNIEDFTVVKTGENSVKTIKISEDDIEGKLLFAKNVR
ncbi:MAG: acetyltransferase [Lachnospiraceae bacterium]|nr:acetyltransferase [Lachnospiraceae bacterium]